METKQKKDNPKVHGPESGFHRVDPVNGVTHEPREAYRLGDMLVVSHGNRQRS